jgi:hypothetical protein
LLGFEPKADEPEKIGTEERMRILDALASGEINPEEAQAQLSGKKTE